MKKQWGAAFGLSFFYIVLSQCLWGATQPAFAVALKQQVQTLSAEQLVYRDLKAGWVSWGPSPALQQREFMGMSAEDPVRAGRLGELWVTLALLEQLERQSIQLRDPVNFYLNDFQLLEPLGEIQLDHLLRRRTGLPLRQSNLYLSDPTRIPTLRDIIVQELKPAILPPGEMQTYQSVGDLVGAQLLKELTSQVRNREIELHEILALYFAPLKWQHTERFQAKTGPAYHEQLAQTAPPYDVFPAAWSTAPDVHGYLTSFADAEKFLQALLRAQPPISERRQAQILGNASQAPLGLFSGQVGALNYQYLDSRMFGQFLRFVVFPEYQAGFVLYYNHYDPVLAAQLTQQFAQQLTSAPIATLEQQSPLTRRLPLRRATRDQVSLLKGFDLIQPTFLEVGDTGLSYLGSFWAKQENNQYQNARGERLSWDGQVLKELGNEQASWTVAKGWYRPELQWGFALIFFLAFMGIFSKRAYELWQYEPTVSDVSSRTDSEVFVSADENPNEVSALTEATESEPTLWDLPLLSALNSLCAGLFFPLFYFGFSGAHVGHELSLAFRNQPTPMLIASLVLPLLALVSGLILSLLLFNDWRARLWKPGQKAFYLLQLGLLAAYIVWLASWNLLGFRF